MLCQAQHQVRANFRVLPDGGLISTTQGDRQREASSEIPHESLGGSWLLSVPNVKTENRLAVLGYNMKRIIKIMGAQSMVLLQRIAD